MNVSSMSSRVPEKVNKGNYDDNARWESPREEGRAPAMTDGDVAFDQTITDWEVVFTGVRRSRSQTTAELF